MAVNLSPVGGAAAQFFDNSGQVLTGGKLYTYLAGTTTPAITYTTNSGITAHSNPIVLNAAGRVPDSGEIWLTDSVLYKFALQDQNGVQIAIWDNIDGINSNFVNYTVQNETQTATQGQTVFTLTGIQYTPATNSLAVYVNGSKQILTLNYIETSSTVVTFVDGLNVGDVVQFTTAISVATNVTSANNVNYIEGGAGSIFRSVTSKLQEYVSVKDFGAVGDGVTDDKAAIQAAIDAVIAAGGGTLYFPASSGGYKITSGLVIDYSGSFYDTSRYAKKIHLKGDGSPASFLTYTAASGQALYLKGNSTNSEAYFLIEGLRITGTGNTAVGLWLQKAAYVVLRDLIVEFFDTGCYFIDTEQIGVYDCEIRYNNGGLLSDLSTITSPNSWSFYNTLIAGNRKYGANITNANAFNYNGGSVQYNGLIGGGFTNYGIELIEAGNGYGTVGFTNMAFEGNGGLADFVSVQTTNPCNISFDNVAFMRTEGFASATVTGAADNGSGAIRLTVSSTAALSGAPVVAVNSVVGTTNANSEIPWSYTVIDATHIDLLGSVFNAPYVSGGLVVCVGFATNNIYASGTQVNATYSITNCSFRSQINYLPSSTRPTIALANAYCSISDDGTNYFQNAIEKLSYFQAQQIGDNNSSWAPYTPTVTAAGGTFAATATGYVKKINKTVYFQAVITTTAYAATPTLPLTITVPFSAAIACISTGIVTVNGNSCHGVIAPGTSLVSITRDGVFPITANGQELIISGTYETV